MKANLDVEIEPSSLVWWLYKFVENDKEALSKLTRTDLQRISFIYKKLSSDQLTLMMGLKNS